MHIYIRFQFLFNLKRAKHSTHQFQVINFGKICVFILGQSRIRRHSNFDKWHLLSCFSMGPNELLIYQKASGVLGISSLFSRSEYLIFFSLPENSFVCFFRHIIIKVFENNNGKLSHSFRVVWSYLWSYLLSYSWSYLLS